MLRRLLYWILFLPLQLLLALLFLLTDLLRFPLLLLKGSLRPGPASDEADAGSSPSGSPSSLCSIVVLNWNGRRLLEESLPALLRAVDFTGRPHEVLVVDNGSDDGSVEWLARHFPRVRLLALEENTGFGEGNNRGVNACRHDVVVLLNNDMIVEEDFLPPLLEGFDDPEVFAVSSQIFFPEGVRREETGNTWMELRRGYPELFHRPLGPEHEKRPYLPVLWAGGGSSAFHRRRFLELGGFSLLFSPCYLEDTDLSLRAWRRGWKILLAARSRVLHRHRSSSSIRFGASRLAAMVEERKLWYLWKNFRLRKLLPHWLLYPFHLSVRFSLLGYLRALRALPAVLAARLGEPRPVWSEPRVFSWIRTPRLYLDAFHPDRHRLSRNPKRLRILIVSAYLPHLGRHGGAGRVFQLLRRAAGRHPVTLATLIENHRERVELRQVLPHCRRVEAVDRTDFIPVSYFPYEPFEEFNSPQLRRRLEQLLAEEDFDLVHFEWTQMAQFADLFPHLPRLVTEIEVNYAAHLTLVALDPNPLGKLKKLYDSLQTLYREVQLCRRVHRVVCVTEDDRGYLRSYLPPENLFVVNTGVDTRYFSDAGPTFTPNTLLFVGAFRHYPNVDAMLYFYREILPGVRRLHPGVHLYVVGSSPPPVVEELGADPSVTVTGYVEDIREYYRMAQVVVVPLRAGVGIRGKILEAWSTGKAVVATPLACQGIRARHPENVMVAGNSGSFVEHTSRLLADEELCRNLGRQGRRTVERFYDWDRLGEAMTRLYEDTVREVRP